MSYYPVNVWFFFVFLNSNSVSLAICLVRRSSKTVNILPGRCVVDWPVSQLIFFFTAFHSIQFDSSGCIRHLPSWKIKKKSIFRISHNLFSRHFFFFRFHILRLKTLALLAIETLCIYTVAVVYENRYLFIVRSLSFFFSSPKRSWRSSVVAHFRFNKNVFFYWRIRFGAPRGDHQDILHEITEKNERVSDKEKKKLYLATSITSSASCNQLFFFYFFNIQYYSRCLSTRLFDTNESLFGNFIDRPSRFFWL